MDKRGSDNNMIDGIPPKADIIIITRKEIYDDMGWAITDPNVEEGYDINGFPVNRIVGAII